MSERQILDRLVALVFQHGGEVEGTAFPFWYVAVKGGALLRRPVMVSHGFWFSREAAQRHLENKSHRYPKSAFVYCDSGHFDNSALRQLVEIAEDAKSVLAEVVE